MHAVARRYQHASDLIAITICQDKAGTDESNRLAAAWVSEHFAPDALEHLRLEIMEGEPFIGFGTPQRLGSTARV